MLAAAVLVFLSYARADAAPARDIAQHLRASGCQVWMDVERIRPGANWRLEVERAIDGADAVVVLASRAAYKSRHVRAELARAERKGRRIVPVWIEKGIDLPLNLESLQRAEIGSVGEICRR